MKRLLKVICVCGILLVLAVIITKTQFVENAVGVIYGETENAENIFEDKWYFNQLISKEREIYLKIARAVNNLDKTVVEVNGDVLSTDNAARAFEAYYLDNPSVFYLSGQYNISISRIFNVTKLEIKLGYTEKKNNIEKEVQALNNKIDSVILEVIDAGMTDFEKEVALHDYLVKNISYYKYTDIDQIPDEKHTAYGALVGKSAVCDGISKAYCILLDKCKIANTIVTGKMEEGHAWNKVLIGDAWYNVDVTSDACGEDAVLSHVYFNLSDEEITKTHIFNTNFDTPKCSSREYNYYEYNDFKLTNKDFFADKIRRIVGRSGKSVLEFSVSENFDIKTVIEELYNIDFNNYRTNGVKEIKYFHVQNILVIPK